MASNIIKKTDGFTLIEVIITLVVTSILALMVLQFTKTATVHGTKTSTWFAKNTQLQMSMEKISAGVLLKGVAVKSITFLFRQIVLSIS